MLQRCYTLSPRSSLERPPDGAGPLRLRCTYPLQSHELNETAAALLAALRPGVPLEALAAGVSPEVVAFLDALVRSGALDVAYRVLPAKEAPSVEVVVPAYADTPGVTRCLAALAAQDYPAERVRVTVVDDASPEPLAARVTVPPGLRVRWLRLGANAGPASARNAAVTTPWPGEEPPAPWLALVDADCVPAPGWLSALAALLEDPAVAAAGGAVRGLRRDSLLARYEDACSSLYLGERPGPVGAPDGAFSYLPSCNLGVRRAAFEAVGGFRAGWRFGEDVDLCWRLHAAGYGLFYHPDAAVGHDHRTRWGAFLQRRRAYARSEAPLRRAHPGRFRALWQPAPGLALGGMTAALLMGSAWPALVTGGALLWLAGRPVWRAGDWPLTVRLAAGGRRALAHLLLQARQLNRLALVLWLPLPFLLPPLWPLAVGVGLAGALAEWLARRPPLPPVLWALGYGAECAAYSLGRTEGLVRAQLPGAQDAPPGMVERPAGAANGDEPARTGRDVP